MEMGPSQQRGRDVIALGSLFSALATLNSGGLFPLAVKLLDLPAHRCLFWDFGVRSFRRLLVTIHSVTLVEETNRNSLT